MIMSVSVNRVATGAEAYQTVITKEDFRDLYQKIDSEDGKIDNKISQ